MLQTKTSTYDEIDVVNCLVAFAGRKSITQRKSTKRTINTYFGKEKDKGIRMDGFVPKTVPLNNGTGEEDLLIHQENLDNPAYAYLLSRMEYPEMPLPFGVLRAVKKPSYNEMLMEQISTAQEKKGSGDLHALFHSADTWEVT